MKSLDQLKPSARSLRTLRKGTAVIALSMIFSPLLSAQNGGEELPLRSPQELSSEHGFKGILYRVPLDKKGQPILDKMEAALVREDAKTLHEQVKEGGEDGNGLAEIFDANENKENILSLAKEISPSQDANYDESFSQSDLGALKPNGFFHRRHQNNYNQTVINYGNSYYGVPAYYPVYGYGTSYYGNYRPFIAGPYASRWGYASYYPSYFSYNSGYYGYGSYNQQGYYGWGYSYSGF